MTYETKLKLYKLRDNAVAPLYGTNDSACFDISAAFGVGEDVTLYNPENEKRTVKVLHGAINVLPGWRVLIPTGWVFGIDKGYSLRIHPRSGLALKSGIVLANAEAVIDSDYIQETFVMVHNISKEAFIIEDGMRIAQGELTKKIEHTFEVIYNELPQETTRTGGLGSTGIV